MREDCDDEDYPRLVSSISLAICAFSTSMVSLISVYRQAQKDAAIDLDTRQGFQVNKSAFFVNKPTP